MTIRIALASAADLPPMDQDEHVLVPALEALGVATDVVPWDDARADWGVYDAVVIRSTWNYTDDLEAYRGWAARLEAAGVLLWNDATVVGWNTHKGYLIELEERGAPIVPTAWLARGDTASLAALARARGWDGVVAKPAVGAGADGLLVVPPGRLPDAEDEAAFAALLERGDTMVQAFVRSIGEVGELSVVVVDGTVSHVVRKRPSGGDVRIQIEFGGSYEPVDPAEEPDAVALAEWLVEATGHDLLYARVDLLADDDGSWMLSELEAVEPSLMLEWVPAAADRLAAAIRARLEVAAPPTSG